MAYGERDPIDGNTASIGELPLKDEQGRCRYTVDEVEVPEGYVKTPPDTIVINTRRKSR